MLNFAPIPLRTIRYKGINNQLEGIYTHFLFNNAPCQAHVISPDIHRDDYSAPDMSRDGAALPGRVYRSNTHPGGKTYRFGFNGKENLDEGFEGLISFEARSYDARLGRFLSCDPLEIVYAYQSTYVFAHNSPIALIDFLGMGDPPKHGDTRTITAGDNTPMTCTEYWDENQTVGGQKGAWVDHFELPAVVKRKTQLYAELKTTNHYIPSFIFRDRNSFFNIIRNDNNSTVQNVIEYRKLEENKLKVRKDAQSDGGGDRNLSDPKQYPGISIYQNNDKSDMTAVTLPDFSIYIGGGYSGRSLTRVMQHEYGHYLYYRFSLDLNYNGQGFTNFYLVIGVPSLFNAATGIGGSHSSYWTEIRSNQWAEIWFGKNLDPDFLKLYPTK